EAGKRRSLRNALRHGLTAETVIEAHEDARAYRALQRAVNADYRPRTNFEIELMARLVSLLWRLRRAVAIESGVFDFPAHRKDWKPEGNLKILYNLIPSLNLRAGSISADDSSSNDSTGSNQTQLVSPRDAIARSFLRLGRTDSRVFERLGRYEMNMWRQTVQNHIAIECDQSPGKRRRSQKLPDVLALRTTEDASISPLATCGAILMRLASVTSATERDPRF